MWVEIPLVFNELSNDPSVNVIVLTGKGRHFCSGIDVSSKETLFETLGDTESEPDGGRRGEYLLRHIQRLQRSVMRVLPRICLGKSTADFVLQKCLAGRDGCAERAIFDRT